MAKPWEKYQSASPAGPWNKYAQAEPSVDGSDAIGAGIEGFGQGASLGYLAQLQALAGQLAPNPTSELDQQLEAEGFKINQGDDSYLQLRDENLARQERLSKSNPVTYNLAQIGGAVATAPFVEARIAKALPAVAQANLLRRGASSGAVIGALQNPGDTQGEISPFQAVERAKNAGIGSVIGAGLGKLGDRSARLKALEDAAPMADDVNEFLVSNKANAQNILDAGAELGAPVLSGQTSRAPLVQNLESMLQNSGSLIGQRRRMQAEKGMDAVRGALNESLDPGVVESAAGTGAKLKQSMAQKIREESKPISALYERLKESTQNIEISQRSVDAISRNLSKLREGKFKGPAQGLVLDAVDNIKQLKTVDDVKFLRTQLRGSLSPTASSAEKNVVAQIDARLKALEESTVVRAAKSLASETKDKSLGKEVLKLVGERKSADKLYAQMMEKLSDLSGIVKKGKVRGPESFAQTIEQIGEEEFTKKLLTKGNSSQLKFLQKEFPQEAEQLFKFERSRILQAATKDAKLDPKAVVREAFKLSPEAQEIIFGTGAVKKLKAAKVYLESLPKNANPSGTEFTRQVYSLFEDPLKWVGSNVRDTAILGVLKASEKGDKSAVNKVLKQTADVGRKSLSSLDPMQRRLRVAAIQGDGPEFRKPYQGNERRKALRLRAVGE